MLSYLVYVGKAAIALAVFYMFYRLLLKKETFHRLNRVVLVGMVVVSFLLPLCIITIHKPIEMKALEQAMPMEEVASVVEKTAPWWPMALTILFWAGTVFVLTREVVSILSVVRIIRRGECVLEDECYKIIVTDKEIKPFSWMWYIVLSKKDWGLPHEPILTHEKAHVLYKHSFDLLLVDTLTAFQWFNPAIWMLRGDLQEIHEYEADDAVLRSGANLKEYQYLLVRKAVGKSGYSVANNFNHSMLKNRIAMMSESKPPLSRGLRVLWLLPVVCLAIGLQVRTKYVPVDNYNNDDILELRKLGVPAKIVSMDMGTEGKITVEGKEISKKEILSYLLSSDFPAQDIGVMLHIDGNAPTELVNDVVILLTQAGISNYQYSDNSPLPLYIQRNAWGDEREISIEEAARIDPRKCSSIKYAETMEKYGKKAAYGAVVFTMK